MADQVSQMQEGISALNGSYNEAALKLWLSPPDTVTHYREAIRERHGETGTWLFDAPLYRSWIDGSGSSFLWLHGKPGCGKTILSSTVIRNLDECRRQPLLYFFFSFRDQTRQTVDAMVRSLLMQLYCQGLIGPLDRLFQSSKLKGLPPFKDDLDGTLHETLGSMSQVSVVIDALDECIEWQPLLSILRAIHSKHPHVRLLATSRPEQAIESDIQCWAHGEHSISLHSSLVDNDINDYIENQVWGDPQLRQRWQMQTDVLLEIKLALTEKANGMSV